MNKGIYFLILVILWGCERKIDLDLNDTEPKLVVEANIENGTAPVVVLTKSTGYFSKITPEILSGSFVHNAEISISNGVKTHVLKEYQLPLPGGYSFYYYSIDSSNLSTAFLGELNTSYSMTIQSEGEQYQSSTTIPDLNKQVDSLFWRPADGGSDTNRVKILVRVTDPPGYGDYIRYLTKINDQPEFLAPSPSVYDDLFVDGTSYEVQLDEGFDRNSDSSSRKFLRGDTVTFKLSGINKQTFDFWRTWEFAQASVGNPFSSPTKVIGNISNDALGYFAGYATQYHTIIIPE